jgi:hypothetical protein
VVHGRCGARPGGTTASAVNARARRRRVRPCGTTAGGVRGDERLCGTTGSAWHDRERVHGHERASRCEVGQLGRAVFESGDVPGKRVGARMKSEERAYEQEQRCSEVTWVGGADESESAGNDDGMRARTRVPQSTYACDHLQKESVRVKSEGQ